MKCGQLKVEVLVMKGVTQSWAGSSRSLAVAFFLNSHLGLIQTRVSKRNLLGAEHPDLTPKAEMRASLDPISRKHKMKPEILWRLSAQLVHSESQVCTWVPSAK